MGVADEACAVLAVQPKDNGRSVSYYMMSGDKKLPPSPTGPRIIPFLLKPYYKPAPKGQKRVARGRRIARARAGIVEEDYAFGCYLRHICCRRRSSRQ